MNIGGMRPNGTRERRRHVRRRIAVRAFLEVPPRAAQPCKVYNVSIGSALVGTAQPLRLDQPVLLHVESFGSIAGHVARVTSTTVAIAFTEVNARALADFIIVNEEADAEQGDISPAA
jgi:hypothetical protein